MRQIDQAEFEAKYRRLLYFVQASTRSDDKIERLQREANTEMENAADGGNFDDAFTMGYCNCSAETAIQARELLDEIGEEYK